MNLKTEKTLLQWIATIGSIVPIGAGLWGVFDGVSVIGEHASALINHSRYLSGLLLGIGICFISSVSKIEMHAPRIRLLTFIVFIGGLSRLKGLFMGDSIEVVTCLALIMELLVTPLLCLWQNSLAYRFLQKEKQK